MTSATAIETIYAGCRMRSRLEARWAVFFDYLEIRWEYEPEGFETPAGRYLPDFLLWLNRPTWFEVKHTDYRPGDDEETRWHYISDGTARRVIVAFGQADPRHLDYTGDDDARPNGRMALYECWTWDGHHAFTICQTCDTVGIEFSARSGRLCDCTPGDRAHNGNDRRIIAAYQMARQARFEHGG